ncbi:isoprenylcysteine carboxylmethyltransferase family protein [Kitasatospora sp. MAP5-34]|uniref:methyltransferase family protein n=1 Tax=Kitasatospora sp. MAP5-34 TaxID=3035102 RepID=UPI0024734E3C|nr:isoprenylcysteine carboxylmethyltransferase family protein [Kitasatospora sp. MAP5-34]MDH6577415.1 protein-S-isoprenylcysteine O-methyltransferase Ste14 [Kitasatospora sp. MAP5-34]
MALPKLLSILGILLWVGYEVILRRRADSDAASWHGDSGDRGSTRLLLGSYAAAVLLNIVLSTTTTGRVPAGWSWAGVAAIVAGLALRAWGMQTLGSFYTRTLRTTDGQSVVRSGPYRLIRHPGYCGSLLVWTGYSLGLGNWIATVAVAALLLSAYTWRIDAEERLLLTAFGGQYADYRRGTKRLLPFVY